MEASGTIIENSGGAPITGAKVCIVDHPEVSCVFSDVDGRYMVGLPPWTSDLDIAVNVTATGHLGFIGLLHERPPGLLWYSQIALRDDADASKMFMDQAGFTYPAPGKAFVMFSVFRGAGGAAVGVGASLSPPSGSGPVYADPVGDFDPTLTSTTSNGYSLFGDLTPGRIEISASDPSCVPAPLDIQAWIGSKPNTVAGVTVANSMTLMTIICL
jgi:hypothetical protein